jgi:TPR repeat protein
MREEFKQSVLRARERAQTQAGDHLALDDEIAAPSYQPVPPHEHLPEQQSEASLDPMPAILREDGLGTGRSPSVAAKAKARPLSQGRWNRGFFIIAGAMLALGGTSFVVVEHLTSSPAERVVAPSVPTQPSTRVAQPAANTKASPIALPPNTEIESPGAAARAASLPATIASASLRHAASNGEPAAEFEIGARFADGRGVSPDLQQAFIWYQRSAMHGYAPAQFRLGSSYERGLGTDKDHERAKLWYRRAAEKGHVKAMHNLAVLAAEATPKPDFNSAVQWFREAAERNLADSQYNLAMLYETGRGVPENFAEAYKWYALALRNGDQEAARRMDVMRSRMSKGEIAAADKAIASWVPTPMYPMPGTSPSERAAP